MIKKNIKKLLNAFGFDLIRYDKEIQNLSFDQIIKKKLIKRNPIIFDVGANEGQSIKKYLNILKNPTIHSFEPVSSAFNIMSEKFSSDKKIYLNNCALGKKGQKKTINVFQKTQNSSFYNINLNTDWLKKRSKQYNSTQKGYLKKKEVVPIITLDQYCKKHKINRIDLLKIDTQGHELEVLSGAKNLIKENKIGIIISEIMFDNVYEKYISFLDIEKKLVPHNFRLVGINLMNNNLFSGLIFAADAMYFNAKYYDI